MPATLTPERQAAIFSALADPIRVRLIHDLADRGEQSGSSVADRLGISLALLCHHTKILVNAGLLQKRKQAQTTYYRIDRAALKQGLRLRS